MTLKKAVFVPETPELHDLIIRKSGNLMNIDIPTDAVMSLHGFRNVGRQQVFRTFQCAGEKIVNAFLVLFRFLDVSEPYIDRGSFVVKGFDICFEFNGCFCKLCRTLVNIVSWL